MLWNLNLLLIVLFRLIYFFLMKLTDLVQNLLILSILYLIKMLEMLEFNFIWYKVLFLNCFTIIVFHLFQVLIHIVINLRIVILLKIEFLISFAFILIEILLIVYFLYNAQFIVSIFNFSWSSPREMNLEIFPADLILTVVWLNKIQ